MHGYGGRADIHMFFGPWASCVLSPMLGFRRCVKSKQDTCIILRLVLGLCATLEVRVVDAVLDSLEL